MNRFLSCLLGLLIVPPYPVPAEEKQSDAPKTVYDFKVADIDGKEVDLADFRGKVLLIVNVASQCGVTSQYETLQAIYEAGREHGLVVMGFPANNFGGQEPGSNAEIREFCTTEYGVTFPMFAKVSVAGDDQIDLFAFLTSAENPDIEGAIGWNFEKFLVGRDGKLLRRFDSNTDPGDDAVMEAVIAALKQEKP